MLPAHKHIIRTNYNTLREVIKDDITLVCKDLFSAKVIPKAIMERILESNNNNADRAMALLDILPTTGPNAFEQLYKSCVSKKLNGVTYILRPGLTTHFKSSRADYGAGNHNEDDDLPDAWPSEEIISTGSAVKVRKINKDDVQIIEHYKYSLSPKGQKTHYSMKNKIKGLALVINNEKFTHFQNRDGTVRDLQSIEAVFGGHGLGFEVNVHHNLTGEQMLEIMKDGAALDHDQFDCFILFILSHGHKGVVFGTDGFSQNDKHYNCVHIEDIWNIFCSVPTLIGKPKIFFIQACQGTAEDRGMFTSTADRPDSDLTLSPGPTLNTGSSTKTEPIENIDNKRTDSSPVNLIQIVSSEVTEVMPVQQEATDRILNHDVASKTLESDKEVNIRQVKQALHFDWDDDLEQGKSDAVRGKTPSFADTFIAIATTPGNLSWRNTKCGTWFIQAITFVFAKYAYKNDVQKLMIQVNNLVSKAETIKGNYKQVADKRDTFTKSLYLFPGLPAENS